MYNYFANETLLDTPVRRAAFSDRTAYVMAEMSRLAYFRFEGGANTDVILKTAREFIEDDKKYATLEKLIRNSAVSDSPTQSEIVLKNILKEKGFQLIKTFNNSDEDAQAFLCKRSDQKIAVLAFRGTEKKLKDIKADVQATLNPVPHKGGEVPVHSGYYRQFASLKDELEKELNTLAAQNYQIFITGHSLGGALAILTVKFLASDSSGACYTFGSPPVGTGTFDEDIKTPIYRIINHVDIVPRMPNPLLVHAVRGMGLLLEIVLSPLGTYYSRVEQTKWYRALKTFLVDAGRYRQSGYGSYLVGSVSTARLRYNVNLFDQSLWWLKQLQNLFRGDAEMISDHSIERYSDMLAAWAKRRAP